jgi:hypothetical protein
VYAGVGSACADQYDRFAHDGDDGLLDDVLDGSERDTRSILAFADGQFAYDIPRVRRFAIADLIRRTRAFFACERFLLLPTAEVRSVIGDGEFVARHAIVESV